MPSAHPIHDPTAPDPGPSKALSGTKLRIVEAALQTLTDEGICRGERASDRE